MSWYLDNLNTQQKEAVLHHGSPLLILAGAGSGKTRVITVKIAYLIDELGVDPHSILAVTFTNKAAGEMRERAASLAPAAAGVFIRTFHSFGAWLLRRNVHLLDMPSGFTIYDDEDSVTLLRSLYPEQNRQTLSRVARVISRAKDYCLGPDDDLSEISMDPEFPATYRAYERRLREIGNADFGDLIMRSVQLLQHHAEVRNRIRDRFRYVLVDEYQDSNVAQYELLKQLVDPRTYVCVVGDDDQSIYRFRGAEVKNILTFHESFPGTHVIRLEENYRSTSRILDVASAVVEKNQGRLGKTLWTRKTGGARPVIAFLDDQEEEVRYCAGLLRPRAAGKAPGKAPGKAAADSADIGPGDTAILYRTNAQSRLFETVFLREGIPYRIIGTLRFYEREEIKDAVAFLKFMANPRDEVSFRRVINKPSRGLGAASVEKIVQAALSGGGDLRQAAESAAPELSKRARSSVAAFLGILAAAESAFSGESLARFVEAVITESGLQEYHARQDEVAGSQKLQNLEELVNAASLYESSREGLVEFLESIELDSSRESDDAAEGERVTLITMHNTKGLEFPRVIITGLEEGLFPRADSEDADELEEERRLFYVAVTRAKESLHLTTCRFRRIHGRMTEAAPSRFLQEIPRELIETVGNSSRFAAAVSGGQAYPPGTGVYHDEYGSGVVVKEWHNGKEAIVMVQFESGMTARFLPRYTRLERISVDP